LATINITKVKERESDQFQGVVSNLKKAMSRVEDSIKSEVNAKIDGVKSELNGKMDEM